MQLGLRICTYVYESIVFFQQNMYACTCMFICICICTCMCICMCTHVCVVLYVYMFNCENVSLHARFSVYVCKFAFDCFFVYFSYTCIWVCTYTCKGTCVRTNFQLCTYVRIHVPEGYVHVHAYIYIYICLFLDYCVRKSRPSGWPFVYYIYIPLLAQLYTHIFFALFISTFMYVCMHLCAARYMHIYIYIHTDTHANLHVICL